MISEIIRKIPLSYYVISGLVNFITSLGMSLFIYLKGKKNKINRTFALSSFTVAQWSLFYFLFLVVKDKGLAEFCMRTCMIGTIFLAVTFTHFIICLLDLKINKIWIKLNYLCGLAIALTVYTQLYANRFEPFLVFPVWGRAGLIFPAYLIHFIINAVYSQYNLGKALIRSTGRRKEQVKYVFFGTTIGYVAGITNFFCWYRIAVPPIPNILISLYVVLVAYAIVRHQLMDIEVIIKKTIVFAGLFLASYAVFASFAYLSASIFENIFRSRWTAMIPSVLVVVLMLRPLESYLRHVTDKYLFQKAYDYRKLLRTFSEEVLTVLDLDMLVNLTVNNLAEIMRLENASVFLYDEENGQFYLEASYGNHVPSENMKDSEEFIGYIRGAGRHLLISDPVRKTALNPAVDKKAKELKAELVIPLRHHDGMIGLIIMGKKKSDEDFTQEDIDVILPLTRTLSIAISNAQLFEKLSEAQAQAAQREKMAVIGTLSAGINHEICNPLGIARGQCEMFLLNVKEGIYKERTADDLLEKAQEIMQKVINETDRATVITKKLSSFAKPAKGRMQDGVSLKNEIDEVISLIEHDLKLDNIIIEKKVDGEIPLIQADRKQIQEIFFNIIRNAAQSIKGSGRITIRGRSRNRKVFIDIEDTGAGISRNNLDRIFDPFFTTKEPGRGTGLGLFIVKQIAERNNGTISVDSEIGKGSAFHLVFEVEGSVKTPGSRNKAAVSG